MVFKLPVPSLGVLFRLDREFHELNRKGVEAPDSAGAAGAGEYAAVPGDVGSVQWETNEQGGLEVAGVVRHVGRAEYGGCRAEGHGAAGHAHSARSRRRR